MRKVEAVKSLGSFAADQWGLVTTAQARTAGVSNVTIGRLVEAGLLEQVSRGVYLVVGAAPPEHMEVRAAWLRLAPERPAWERGALDADGGVVSHTTATLLHQIGDIPSPTVELTVPKRRTTRERGVRLRRGTLSCVDITTVDGLPVTTIERTIADLLRDRADGGHIGGIVADAQRRNLLDISHAADLAAPYAAAYGAPADDGRALLARLLAHVGDRLTDERARDEDLAVAMLTGYALHASAKHPHPAREATLAALADAVDAAGARPSSGLTEVPAWSDGMRSERRAPVTPGTARGTRIRFAPYTIRETAERPTARIASAVAPAAADRNPLLESRIADIAARALPGITAAISADIASQHTVPPAHNLRRTAPRRHRLRAKSRHPHPDLQDTCIAVRDDGATDQPTPPPA